MPPCTRGIRTSVNNGILMSERIITAIFTEACSNLCLTVICCYAPKQVAEKGRKNKFYLQNIWNEAPAYKAVVKVKAGKAEDESRNKGQKNRLGERTGRSWADKKQRNCHEVHVYSYHWWHLAPSWIYRGSPDGHPQKTDGPLLSARGTAESLLDVKVYSDAEGQQWSWITYWKDGKYIKAQGRDGWHWI